ncbi:hypothetical protein Leryth_001226 [Lithospermum erythrorhizon]|nr:hypothetical protein Leryth_001226 [Lithospermum erythrorhizon]
MPEWIIPFIQNTFFGSCEEHKFQKNELNKYCITCDSAACKYCVLAGNHEDHILLKIYRHVYKDVVPLREIECYMNCSKIQSYKCNKIWVIALTPLPHNGSGSQIAENETCQTCKRRLYDPDKFRFCSISCQVSKSNNKSYSFRYILIDVVDI